jgi:hypothetical protein
VIRSGARTRAAFAVVIVLLLVGTTIPGSLKADIEGQLWTGWPWSSTAHFVLFAVIAALPVYGPGRWGAIRALALAAFLAVLTECLQSLVPGRHPMLRDGLIDLAGTAAGLMIAAAIRSQIKSPHEAGSRGN